MKLPPLPLFISILLYLTTIIATIAHYGIFSTNPPWFYLVNTPAIFLMIPIVFHSAYLFFAKQPLYLCNILIFSAFYLFVVLLPGKSLTLVTEPLAGDTTRICSLNSGYFFEGYEFQAFEMISHHNCDILALQEVWGSSSLKDTLLELRTTYYPNHYVVNYGEFVFYYPQYLSVTIHPAETDGFLSVRVNHSDSQIHLISTHLWNPITHKPTIQENQTYSYTPSYQARKEQEKEYLTYIHNVKQRNENIIAFGDYNSVNNAPFIRKLANELTEVTVPLLTNRNTYSTRFPIISIDHAFVSPTLRNSAKKTIMCSSLLSDHCLLILDIVL